MGYRRKDTHYLRARREGYRARSAYKLIELDRRFGLLHEGDRVVDLGSWPGGWLQVALERVGTRGRIVGVDVTGIAPFPAPNAIFVCGDVRDPTVVESVREQLGRRADVVLSDLAPKLTGVTATDQARITALAEATIGALPTLLRPGGSLLMKVFEGPDNVETLSTLRREFAEVRATRPAATRHGSAELYAVALGYRRASGPA